MNELERVEAQALRDALLLGGGRAGVAGGAMCVAHPDTPAVELNRALPVGQIVDVTAIAAWFDAQHAVVVPPGYLGLEQMLDAAGYTHDSDWMKFRRDDAPPAAAPTDLRVEETLDAAAFSLVLAEGSRFPLELATALSGMVGAAGWHCFLAWSGDEPAAGGALYADGEWAWLGVASTREQFRGRGGQSAILAARISRGIELGARAFASETGSAKGPSYRNLLRAGFREAYLRPNWRSGVN